MNRDDDKKVIGIWLDCYNDLSRTDFRVDSHPDEDDRSSKSIDALCKDSTGRTLGLEHTRIEAFPGEMNDNRRFLDVLGRLEKKPSLAEVGVQTSASIAVGAIPNGIRWSTLGTDLAVFLSQNVFGLGLGSHSLAFTQGSVSIPLRIDKMAHRPGEPGSFLVGRSWPGKSNEPTVKKAFEDKLPKLRASNADLKILLLEQNSVAGSVRSDVHEYFGVNGVPDWMPDETWMLWTPVLDAENYMHVRELYPDLRNLKADWSDGNITTKYP